MTWNFDKYSDRMAVVDDSGSSLTFGQLKKEGDLVAGAIGHRALVFCLCANTAGSVIGYTAFVRHRIVPLMLSKDLEEELLTHLTQKYQPEYFWMPEQLTERFPEYTEIYRAYGFCLLKTGFDTKYPLHDDLAMLLPTSGSTGSPKLVRQSYHNTWSNAESMLKEILAPGDVALLSLPMHFTYVLAILNSHLLGGYKVLPVSRSMMQKEFWDFFRENGSTEFHGVPFHYEILHRLGFEKMDLPSLRFLSQSGGKLSDELHEQLTDYCRKTGVDLLTLYGQCETTACMGFLKAEKADEKRGSMGKAIIGSRFWLVDDDGTEITQPGVKGELAFEGPGVTLGYAECGEDLAKGDERGGVILTGDMAEFDDEGYYYIVGRKKRFLKLYGIRVSMDEVENLIRGHFEGISCAVGGTDKKMIIYLTDASLSDAVTEFIAEKTGINYAGYCVKVIDEIPQNEAGKVLYSKLPE